VDALRADLIHSLFSVFSTGLHSLDSIRALTEEWGLRTREGKPVCRSQIYEILTNPFYYGIMLIKGKPYPHRYPPLIEKNLFDKCQQVFKNWNKKPFATYGAKKFVFRGILTSKANGKTVSPLTKSKKLKHGGTGEWTYLRSWNKDGKLLYIREEKILEQAEKALHDLVLPPETIKAMTGYLLDINRVEHDFLRRRMDELKAEDSRIQSRMTGLMELLMDGAVTREEYDVRRVQYREKQIEIANELAANRNGDDGFKDAMLLLLDLCSHAPELFAGSNVEEKRSLLNFVFENLSLDDETLCFSYRIPFGHYAEMQKEGKWWRVLIKSTNFSNTLQRTVIK
jgi:hypothetical protein